MTDSLHFTALGGDNVLTVTSDYPTGLYDQSIALVSAYSHLLSFYDDQSLLSELNANAGESRVHIPVRPIFNLIATALDWSKRGLGFNVLMGPLTRLWREAQAKATAPSDAAIAAALALSDPNLVDLDSDSQTVLLTKPGMAMDLGAIAKGFILDQLTALWATHHATGQIDLAGNMALIGNSPAGVPLWQVPVSDGHTVRATVASEPGAVMTSSIHTREFKANGTPYHHLLDPATGRPIQSTMASITVFTKTATLGDILSSIGFYAGVPAGYDVIDAADSASEAVFITQDTRVYPTSGLRERIVMA
ncbi:FAD:protein FMN transferase [Lacticaseibacillus nasuensis]|uniref:FAD:protein FMN transferase n=1 Tax=Lacticaseibacillus nasuensis JCM 17158 TaxID=1291734 RepID=A0A0R1JT27_9LACO|nr:FAD:protein FMN transferase [Lacticaseibacillus nasuensis]KRK70874.1 thiamine biosynthesis membrane-associated lipoprotein [Lacticaseibacillus nasuensis JCM 17158]